MGVPIGPLISFKDKNIDSDKDNIIYGYQQLLEDFQHLQIIHANVDRIGFQKMCEKFEKSYPCDIDNCIIFARHYRDRTQLEKAKNLYYFNSTEKGKAVSMQNNKDM